MTNAEHIRELKTKHGLSSNDLAKIAGRSKVTVDRWLLSPDSPYFSKCPDNVLEWLKHKLQCKEVKK